MKTITRLVRDLVELDYAMTESGYADCKSATVSKKLIVEHPREQKRMNKNLILKFAAFLVAVITFSACSSDDNDDEVVKESKVYGTYVGDAVADLSSKDQGGGGGAKLHASCQLVISKKNSKTNILLITGSDLMNVNVTCDQIYTGDYLSIKKESEDGNWSLEVIADGSKAKLIWHEVNMDKYTTIDGTFEGVKQN